MLYHNLLFILLGAVQQVRSLKCLEGADCVRDASCHECEGLACTRITSFNLEDNKELALTCIPFDARNFEVRQLEAEGCRQIGDREICVCSYSDYCNSTDKKGNSIILIMFFVFLLLR